MTRMTRAPFRPGRALVRLVARLRRAGGLLGLWLCLCLLGAAPLAHAASFNLIVTDDPGEGFNDPAPFTPVGGNNATTLGAARLNVVKEAARLWGAKLDSPVAIDVAVSFDPIGCGQYLATASALFTADPNTPGDNRLYPLALLSARTGIDQGATVPGNPPDITASFNTSYGTGTGCAGFGRFYYGLDHKASRTTELDLLTATSHELGHGLGFFSLVDETTGRSTAADGALSVFDARLFDETTRQTWDQDTDAQRQGAIVSNTGLSWAGNRVNAAASGFLTAGRSGSGRVLMYAPPSVEVGSSISHWDKRATPNLLMEPVDTRDPVDLDITPCALADIGWTLLVTNCRDGAVTNQAPVAQDQSVQARRNTARTIQLGATDAENDALTYTVVTGPAHGTLSGTTGQAPVYTPAANYLGPDSFTFRAADTNAQSAPATVSITVVDSANQAPVAAGQSVATRVNTARAIVLAATDAENDSLTYAIASLPAHGTLSGAAPNVTYTPASGYAGADSFTFTASDGAATSSPATVSINVAANAAPMAAGQTLSVPEDMARSVVLSGSDADGDALTYAVATPPAHGTLSGTAPNLTYTPAANYNGADGFTFTASDGRGTSNVATVAITVTPVNDAPVATDQAVTATVGQAREVTLRATDADNDALTYTVLSQPIRGTLSGTAPSLAYTATSTGADSFTFEARDASGARSGVRTVTIANTAPASEAAPPPTNGSGALMPPMLLAFVGLAGRARRRKCGSSFTRSRAR